MSAPLEFLDARRRAHASNCAAFLKVIVLDYTPTVDLEQGLRRTLATFEERARTARASTISGG